MSSITRRAQNELLMVLKELAPEFRWVTEEKLGTGVGNADLLGRSSTKLVYIEMEMRRADPVTNVVKVFRHIDSKLYLAQTQTR